jgi:hypothetical protein
MQTTNAHAAPRCQHIKDNGHLCGSPALSGQPFCYNHDRAHHPPVDPRKNPVAFIPFLENGQSIQIAVTNIARAICGRQLDAQQANAIFNGMRLLKTSFEYCYPMGDGPEAHGYTEAMADALARAYATPEEAKEEREEAVDPEPTRVIPERESAHTTKCGTDVPVGDRRAAMAESAIPTAISATVNVAGIPTSPTPPSGDELAATTLTSPSGEVNPHWNPRVSVGDGPEDKSPSPIGATPANEDVSPSGKRIFASPISHLPGAAPLTDTQLNYCRFVLRYGPTHPEFNDCSRRLDHHIATIGATA